MLARLLVASMLCCGCCCGGTDTMLPSQPSTSSGGSSEEFTTQEAETTAYDSYTGPAAEIATYAPQEDECEQEKSRQEALHQCGVQTNYTSNADILNSYSIEKLLLLYGGPPGKVGKADVKNVEELPKLVISRGVENATDYFADFFTENSTATYNRSSSDLETFVRVEEAQLDWETGLQTGVRGELWWTPPDLCGYMRVAVYSLSSGENDTMSAFVISKHCQWDRENNTIQCYGPHADPCLSMSVMSGVSSALMASLIG